jgi:hypothetical protein
MAAADDSDLPQVTDAQLAGLEAAAVFARWTAAHGALWRPGDQATDFGVDGELELTGAGRVSAQLVKVQIKGARGVGFDRAGICRISVRRSTRNYWALMRLPVVAVLVDLETDEMYWTVPKLPLVDDYLGIAFSASESITANSDQFHLVLIHVSQHPAQAEELDRVPFFVESLRELTYLS